jgi:hypothetical protein
MASTATMREPDSVTGKVDLSPYVSRLRQVLEEAGGQRTSFEQMKALLDALLRVIERFIQRICHLCGVAYNGVRQGVRGENLPLAPAQQLSSDAEVHQAEISRGRQGVPLPEALALIDGQVGALVEHISSGRAWQVEGFGSEERVVAILEDLARSREDYAKIANSASAAVEENLRPLMGMLKGLGHDDTRGVVDILRRGPEDSQARLIDRDGAVTVPMVHYERAMASVRRMEIAAHAVFEEACLRSPALQQRLLERARKLMPGAIELDPLERSQGSSVPVAGDESTSQALCRAQGPHDGQSFEHPKDGAGKADEKFTAQKVFDAQVSGVCNRIGTIDADDDRAPGPSRETVAPVGGAPAAKSPQGAGSAFSRFSAKGGTTVSRGSTSMLSQVRFPEQSAYRDGESDQDGSLARDAPSAA